MGISDFLTADIFIATQDENLWEAMQEKKLN